MPVSNPMVELFYDLWVGRAGLPGGDVELLTGFRASSRSQSADTEPGRAMARIRGVSQGDGTAQWRVPLSDLLVEEEHLEAAREAIASGWWSMGPRVAEFERAFSENCDGVRALAVANGTAALHLALLGCGCGPGDEVVVPSLTFVAAANAIAVTGATPVFCDIVGERDLNVSPADVEALSRPGPGRSSSSTTRAFRATWRRSARSPMPAGSQSSRTPRTRWGGGSADVPAARWARSAASASSPTRTSRSARAG